ncbi:MAG: biotin-dependent carboxyltransferase family protein [Pseudomonadota bacterium]
MSLEVVLPGMLSLLQDRGRFGAHNIGLTTGGPLDPKAYRYCNRLLGNASDSTVIEISFGGAHFRCQAHTFICVTGASMPLTINGETKALWTVHPVAPGDDIQLAYAITGCRSYLGVADGFQIAPSFGSTATVMREQIGGLHGDKLLPGDLLPCSEVKHRKLLRLAPKHQPRYQNRTTVRVVPGYQQNHFSQVELNRFYSEAYKVSDRCDRMGYRLEGAAITSDMQGMLSEGICFGAIQIPADGQPIVLLNDRQTIGGYPKLGSALSLDAARLAQLRPGDIVHFAPITEFEAHNALHLAESAIYRLPLEQFA